MGKIALAGVIIGLAALVARLRARTRVPEADEDWCRIPWDHDSCDEHYMTGVQVDLRPYYASSVAPAYEVARNYTGGNAA